MTLRGVRTGADQHSSFRLGWLRFLVAAGLAFCILYNFSFQYLPVATSGRVSLIVLLLLTATTVSSKFKRDIPGFNWILFLPLPYALIQMGFTGDSGQVSRFVHLFAYSFIGGYLLSILVPRLRTILLVLLAAITLQAVLICYTFFNYGFRVWVDAVLVSEANFTALNIYRASGFSGSTGAALSVVQSLGVLIAAVYFKKYGSKISPLRAILLTVSVILCIMSCILTGRTGMLLSIIILVYFVFSGAFGYNIITVISVAILSLFALSFVDFVALLPDDFSVYYFVNWASELFRGDTRTIDALVGMKTPPLTVETFLGTGLVSLRDGVNPSGNDSGFIQTYYALGLVMSAICYTGYALFLKSTLSFLNPLTALVLGICFFALEFKEPFLFKYALPFVLVSIYGAVRKELEGLS